MKEILSNIQCHTFFLIRKWSIAVFENFVEIISRIHCPKHATPTVCMGVTCWNSISHALELSFIDLAAAVTRNQEGMPTFDVQAMVRGYHVYQHVWDASIHEELPCASKATSVFAADMAREGSYFLSERSLRIRQLRPWILSIHSFEVLKHSHLNCYARVKYFVEIISRMTRNSRNSRKFRPAKFLRYTVKTIE